MIAEQPAELLEIRWQGLREIRRYAPQWQEHIDRLYRERSLVIHLRETQSGRSAGGNAANDRRSYGIQRFGDFEWSVSYRRAPGGDAGAFGKGTIITRRRLSQWTNLDPAGSRV